MGDVEELLSEVARVSAARDKQPTLIVKSTAIATISLIEERLVDALALPRTSASLPSLGR